MKDRKYSVRILGTRGIPAQHGGFETFAEYLALYLVKQNWDVTVYCQDVGKGSNFEDEWNGIKLIHIPVSQTGAAGTVVFDWKSTIHSARSKDLVLTLGYNTAIFCALYRVIGINNLINMDGIEWKRGKWSYAERTWFYLNERAGCRIGNHLIADHPEIKNHLATRVSRSKITMIPYGADSVEASDPALILPYGLAHDKYAIVIARPEPENSILEIVRAFSARKRGIKLAILGNYDGTSSDYQQSVLDAASDEVCFLGAIYEKPIINSLRYHALLYIHGHTVGGTNPSLVEALGAGNAILAHDNKFNRWVVGNDGRYFHDENACLKTLDGLIGNVDLIAKMKVSSRRQHRQRFTWEHILNKYESLLLKHHPLT